jgi:hypothetical protein
MVGMSAKTTSDAYRAASAPVAAILAWLLPGLGHWFIGERARGAIFFIVVSATFWGGVAVGGVRTTVAPTENGAWIAAQLCLGPQTFLALYWNHRLETASKAEGAKDLYRAAWPASSIAVVYSGVAGLLNLLVIIDALARAERARLALAGRPTQKRMR